MRIRESNDGLELRLLRVIYDKQRKQEAKDPKREVTLGHIRAACGPDEIDLHLRLLPGCHLRSEERAQLVRRLNANRPAAKHDDGGSVVEMVRALVGELRQTIEAAVRCLSAACGYEKPRSRTEVPRPALGATRQESSREATRARDSSVGTRRAVVGSQVPLLAEGPVRAQGTPKAVSTRKPSGGVLGNAMAGLLTLARPARGLGQHWLQVAASALKRMLQPRRQS